MTPSLPAGQRVLVSEYGETPDEAIEKFVTIEHQLAPDPAALKAHEVLVRVRSVAVAWVDLLMSSGQYQHMVSPPYTPGMEFSGVVLAVGSAVDAARLMVGDRVFADFMKIGPRSYGDYQKAGGFATYVVAPADALLRVPQALSFDEAAVLLQAYETAYHCLVVRGQVQPDEWVMINGASGLTGLAAVQVCKLLGARVIATGRSLAKLAMVREQGADHLVCTQDDNGALRSFRDEVKALTQGRGVDVVYDAVGGDTTLESLRCTAFGARILIVGWTSTPNVARGKGQRGAPNANTLPTNLIQMKSLSVLGCPTGIAAAKDPSIRPPRLAKVLEWAESGAIRPVISQAYPLSEFRQALRARWQGAITGGCVLHP